MGTPAIRALSVLPSGSSSRRLLALADLAQGVSRLHAERTALDQLSSYGRHRESLACLELVERAMITQRSDCEEVRTSPKRPGATAPPTRFLASAHHPPTTAGRRPQRSVRSARIAATPSHRGSCASENADRLALVLLDCGCIEHSSWAVSMLQRRRVVWS